MSLLPEAILSNLSRASFGLSLATICLGLLPRGLRLKAPRLEQFAWGLVLMQGVVFVPLSIPVPSHWLFSSEKPAVVTDSVNDTAASGHRPAIDLAGDEPASTESAPTEVADRNRTRTATPPVSEHGSVSLLALAFAVWLTGFVLLVGLELRRYCLYVRRLHAVGTPREEWISEWRQLLDREQVTTPIPLVITHDAGPALAWLPSGYRLVIPRADWELLAAPQRLAILRHELAHFQRRDLWTALPARTVALLHWFNPCAWWAAAEFSAQAEYICDQVAAGEQPTEFAAVLIELGSAKTLRMPAVQSIRQGDLLRRVQRLLSDLPLAPRWQTGLVVTLAAASLLSALVRLHAAPPLDDAQRGNAGRSQTTSESDADVVVGTVVTTEGKPLAGIEVEAYRQYGTKERVLITNNQGQIRVPKAWWSEPRFAGEQYILTAIHPEFGLGWFEIRSSGATSSDNPLAEPRPFRINLLPPGRTFSGRLLNPQHEPVNDVRVQVVGLQHPENERASFYGVGMTEKLPFPAATTDRSGRFQISMPDHTVCTLRVMHPDWVVMELVSNRDAEDYVLQPSGKIAGRVVLSETGQPVRGVRLHASRLNKIREKITRLPRKTPEESPNCVPANSGSAVTNADGAFEISGLFPSEYELYINVSPGRDLRHLVAATLSDVQVQPGETTRRELVLQPGRHVTGRVVWDATGQPVAEVNINVSVYSDPERRSLVSSPYPRTNDQGEFECFTLPGFAWFSINLADQDGRAYPGSSLKKVISPDGDPTLIEFRLAQSNDRLVRPGFSRRYLPGGSSHSQIMAYAFNQDWTTLVIGDWINSVVKQDDSEVWKAGKARGQVHLWNSADNTKPVTIGEEFGAVTSVAISPNGKTVYAACMELGSFESGEVWVWDVATRKPLGRLKGHTKRIISVAASPDGGLLASGSFDRSVRVWDAATLKELSVITVAKSPYALAFSPDSQTLALGLANGETQFWDRGSGRARAGVTSPDFFLHAVCFSPDGTRLATCGLEEASKVVDVQHGLLYVWDLQTSKVVLAKRMEEHISDVAFSPGGRFLAGAMHHSMIWNVETGEDVGIISRSISASEDRIQFSADGTRLAIGGILGVSIWDVSGLNSIDN